MYLIELIEKLKKADQDYIMPIEITNPHSWRGIYADLAFEFDVVPTSVRDNLAVVKSALGKTYEGYKGGDFTMSNYADVHFSYVGRGADFTMAMFFNILLGNPMDFELDN